jgi:hypothetical protein
MDTIEILFKEYDALRKEISSFEDKGYQLTSVGGTLFAALIAWIASKHPADYRFWLMVLMPMCIFAGLLHFIFREISFAAQRLKEIEADINRRSGENLLEWQTKWCHSSWWFIRRKRPRSKQ